MSTYLSKEQVDSLNKDLFWFTHSIRMINTYSHISYWGTNMLTYAPVNALLSVLEENGDEDKMPNASFANFKAQLDRKILLDCDSVLFISNVEKKAFSIHAYTKHIQESYIYMDIWDWQVLNADYLVILTVEMSNDIAQEIDILFSKFMKVTDEASRKKFQGDIDKFNKQHE